MNGESETALIIGGDITITKIQLRQIKLYTKESEPDICKHFKSAGELKFFGRLFGIYLCFTVSSPEGFGATNSHSLRRLQAKRNTTSKTGAIRYISYQNKEKKRENKQVLRE